MKKLLFFIVLFFYLTNLFGQIPFAPLGAKFYYKQSGLNSYHTKTITKDTVIQGKYCTMIDFMYGPGCGGIGNITYYVHQDGEKVYRYDEESSAFQLIYDFDKDIGESWRLKLCSELWGPDSVTVTVSDKIGDTQHFEIVPDGNIWIQSSIVVKRGIGATVNALLTLPPWVDSYSVLRCYETPTTGIIQVTGSTCQAPSSTDDANEDTDILVWPNPTKGNISLKFPLPISNNSKWMLFDQLGRTVKQETLTVGQIEPEIELGKVGAGLYFWKLMVEEKTVATGKLIVLK